MKKRYLLILTFVVAVFLLVSCADSENNTNINNTESTTTAVQTTSGTPTGSEDVKDASIVSGGVAKYIVIHSNDAYKSDSSLVAANEIVDMVKNTTGVTLKHTTDYMRADQKPSDESCEILVGLTNRAESIEAAEEIGYDDYLITRKGNKIVVMAFSEVGYDTALAKLRGIISESGSEGELTLSDDIECSGSVTKYGVLDGLPLYDESSPANIVDLADENYMVYVMNTTEEKYFDYRERLEDSGFLLYAENEIAENSFATYTGGECVINCYFSDNDDSVRIIVEPDDTALPPKSESYVKTCDPAFRIVGLEFYGKDESGVYNQIGLFMVWRLSDGRLVVIDGGGHYSAMGKKVYETLKDMSPDKENITVAAWIFTHAHGDHVGGFIKFAGGGNQSKVKVEKFIFNFTNSEIYDTFIDGEDRGRLDGCREVLKNKYSESDIIKAHSGQVFCFADMEIEMLYTPDDHYPERFKRHNVTSLVFRVTIGGKTFMVLGDAYTTTSDLLVARYGEALKSDIVQVSHHGYAGGTVELYAAIDPDIAFWPGGDNAFPTLSEKKYNKYLINTVGLKAFYRAGGSRVYTFTLPNDYMYADEELLAA